MDVLEVLGVLREEFRKWRFDTTKIAFQAEKRPGWDREVVQEG